MLRAAEPTAVEQVDPVLVVWGLMALPMRRQGQAGPPRGQVTLKPGEAREVQIRLIYPADATPPQVLTVRPVKQS